MDSALTPWEEHVRPYDQGEDSLEWLVAELPEQYSVLSRVSQGGMGAIYKTKNRYTGALFAIKVMLPELAVDPRSFQRFTVEAKATMSLTHDNICRVYDFGRTGQSGMPYLVMEWIEGISLARKVERDGPMASAESIHIYRQIASALAHAHANGVVHRDLKPQNIMISRNSTGSTVVHLVDFGIAKVLNQDENSAHAQGLTKTGTVVGTPLFMSPEQARGIKLDGRTDVYSAGCVMHFVLAGRPPFLGSSHIDTITKHFYEAPPKFDPASNVPQDLQKIIFKSMEKEPADRYKTMDHVLDDLDKMVSGGTVQVGRLSQERQKTKKKVRWLVEAVVYFVIALSLSLVVQNLIDLTDKKPGAKTPVSASSTRSSAKSVAK